MSGRPSERMVEFGSQWTDFHNIDISSILFENLSRRYKFYLNLARIMGTLHKGQYTFMTTYRAVLLRMMIFSHKFLKKKRFYKSVSFFRKSCPLWDNVKKYCKAGQATNDSVSYAHCILDTWNYQHTFKIWNTQCAQSITQHFFLGALQTG